MKRIVQKTIVIGFIVAAFAGFAFVFFLDVYYYQTSPREPDPTSGKIYPHHLNIGTRVGPVYLTRTQLLPSQAMFYVFPTVFLTGYFLNKHWKAFRNPQDDMPKKLS
jgi:hypothetical protein